MKTKAVRLYGKEDLRLEEFELPKIKDDEILASVITDSLCTSSWKLAKQGEDHKKTPNDISKNPIIIGHEFCGEILDVGKRWKDKFKAGMRYVIQANLQLPDKPDCPGYSYKYIGGNATHIVIPKDVMEQGCLIEYKGETYFEGALIEPLSCVIGAFNANYHLIEGTYNHKMGIKEGGNLLIMGGTGPMGLLAIDYALNGSKNPKKIVVTDVNEDKLKRAKELYPSANGIEVEYVNVSNIENQEIYLKNLADGGYDDIFVLVPVTQLLTQAANLLNPDGCLNFFAGPQDKKFSADINFYDIHYNFTHFVGTSGGNIDDMKEAVKLIEKKRVNVAKIVSHILGLNAAAETTINLPQIYGGKKLVYTQKNLGLASLTELIENGDDELREILNKNNGIWSKEAEDYILNKSNNI